MTAPGVYDGIDEQQYHADTASLSVSGAKKLLPPSCPALFKHDRDHGQPHKAVFDFGHAAHTLVLGVGADIAVIDAEDWRGKAAREQREEAYADGRTPLLTADHDKVQGMAEAIRSNPIASALLDPTCGKAEQSLYWHDTRHDVIRRGRLDWMRDVDSSGRLIITDYKTTVSAEPGSIARDCAKYLYHCQAAWYIDTVRALGLADDVAFVFLFQMKTAPYLITPIELSAFDVDYGRKLNDKALALYAECVRTDTWPGFVDDITLINLPSWATRDVETYA